MGRGARREWGRGGGAPMAFALASASLVHAPGWLKPKSIVRLSRRALKAAVRASAHFSLRRRTAVLPSTELSRRSTMLVPRSPSDRGQGSSANEEDASQKRAVKAWKTEKTKMPSRMSKQKAKVVAK